MVCDGAVWLAVIDRSLKYVWHSVCDLKLNNNLVTEQWIKTQVMSSYFQALSGYLSLLLKSD